MNIFFILSGVFFWVLISAWMTAAVWQYVRWTREEREELIEALNESRSERSHFVQHAEALTLCLILFPVFVLSSFFKDE